MRKYLALILSAVWLSGCIHTEEMQLAPNIVRLDTEAQGALFVGHTGDVTLQRAAKVTIANGYDFFKLSNPQMGHGSEFVGVSAYGNGNFAFASPVYAHTSEVAVTVVMYRQGDPQTKDAFDAKAVLAKLGE